MMKVATGLFALLAIGLLPAVGAGQAKGPQGGGGHCGCPHCGGMTAPGPAQGAGAQFDPDTITTLRGTITDVAVVASRGGRGGGVHVSLRSNEGTHDALLGPGWFLEREGLALAKGDGVEISGSLVDADGKDVMVAAVVRKGDKTVRLRDEQGLPAWAGGPRR